MPLAFVYTRKILLLLLLLFFTNRLGAQTPFLCSSCDEVTLASIPNTKSIQIFKCPITFAGLSPIYKWGVKNTEGNISIKPTWDSIGWVNHQLVEVYQYIPQRKKAPLKAGLLSLDNKQVLPIQYDAISELRDPYYTIEQEGRFKLWHKTTGFISNTSYDSILIHHDDIFLYNDKLIYHTNTIKGIVEEVNAKRWLNTDTYTLSPTPYDTIYLYRIGDPVLQTVLADSVVDSAIDHAVLLYRSGQALKWNFTHQYTQERVSKQAAICFIGTQHLQDSTLIKIKERTQADTILMIDHSFLFKRKKLWGYADTLGNIFIAPVYDSLGLLYKDRIAVKMKNKWGFLDRYENIIAQPYYTAVGDFRYGSAWVKQNNKYNFLNLSGKVLNSTWYDSIAVTHTNYIVYAKGKVGLVNHLGQEVIGTRYLQILDFGQGACVAQTTDRKWLLLDYKENRISQRPYSYVNYLPQSKVYVLKK